ncbi:HNH endonuclease [Arthrobacter pityocampae]|uniref:HNH endonuclease n=1 Tax=Arthrobacter pityocampae TaxID=547334 RepID=A0A2S5IYY5_9MICC|nr:HNH endonuclease signature motif containing protein [Arthrobacter pityocampae]PPB49741.1 HNH endonuclease [Arthrobacter pityocampae]
MSNECRERVAPSPAEPVAADPVEGYEESLVSRLRALEDLKSAVAADQARTALALDIARRRAEAAAGMPADQRGRGVGAEIALARRESPHRGSRLLGLARTLVIDMPHTLAALECGVLDEWRATLIVRETICPSAEDRRAVDAELAADPRDLEGVGTREVRNRAQRIDVRPDLGAAVDRALKAAPERHVSCRPAPDTMAYLTTLLPAAEAISAYSALSRDADTQTNAGGNRGLGRGQLMADALVERVTGAPAGSVRVDVQSIMTDRTLLQGDSEPAYLPGYGYVPAQYARNLLRDGSGSHRGPGETSADARDAQSPAGAQHPEGKAGHTHDQAAQAWLRRLYTAPDTGRLVAMDSRARLFPPGLRRLIAARDATCRTPYCDAPIRQFDHIVPWRLTGSTNADGGQGLCESCNYVEEALGWSSRPLPGARHAVERRTPTGHSYVSEAPPLPGTSPPRRTTRPVHSVTDFIIHRAAA